MKKIDNNGLFLCELLGKVFEHSKDRYECSSEVFIRRLMHSEIAKQFTSLGILNQPYTEDMILDSLDLEYGVSFYGSNKYAKRELYWIGYIYMYFAYTYEYSLLRVYKMIKGKDLKAVYSPYHTLDCETAIERLIESKNLIVTDEALHRKGVEILKRIRSAV